MPSLTLDLKKLYLANYILIFLNPRKIDWWDAFSKFLQINKEKIDSQIENRQKA